jgi:ATP-binding cassette subfamily C (CFTR/MRP) protein 1
MQIYSGEMNKQSGYVGVNGTIAYVPQQAWIQNLSVRDNIVFGQKFDQQWYDIVVDSCALRADIATLPAGDETEIGEKVFDRIKLKLF